MFEQMSPEAQYRLALQMPVDRLIAIVRGQPAQIDPATALAALKVKNQTKTAVQGMQAQQQLQQPSVASKEVQEAVMPEMRGVGALPAPNMGGFADGGVVGYTDGGEIQRFQGGGLGASFPNPYQGTNTSYADTMNWLSDKWRKFKRTPMFVADPLTLNPEANLPASLSTLTPSSAADPAAAPVAAPAAPTAPVAPAAPAAPAARVTAPAAPAAAVPMQGLTMGDEAPTQEGIAALAQGPQTPAQIAGTAGTAPSATRARFEDMATRASVTQPYMDKMNAALKSMTATPEERSKQKEERLGVMALEAAQMLLQPGSTAAGARGAALGNLAKLTQQYSKEDKEDKRALLGMEINMLGAQMHAAQGDQKLAADMFNQAETLAFHYADLAGKEAQRKEESKLGWAKLSVEEKAQRSREAYEKAHAASLAETNRIKEMQVRAYEKRFANAGQITPVQLAKFQQAAEKQAATEFGKNMTLALEYRRKYPNLSEAQRVQMHAQTLLPGIVQQAQGLGALAVPSTAGLLPNTAASAADIIDMD